MLNTTLLYSYNDVVIQPTRISKINSRSECRVLKDCYLPIFTAPMSTVVNESNFHTFKNNRIIPIMPRNIDIQTRLEYLNNGNWIAVSLKEFDEYFTKIASIHEIKVLIDVANGHMQQLYDLVDEAKALSGDKIKIMIGNIANPRTYVECFNHGIDYVRVGIGGGSGCITSSNTGIHYPIASLLNEIHKIKSEYEKTYQSRMPKIIADGGIKGYSDVIKALALGADYVMIGSLFAQCLESAAPKIYNNNGYELSINISNFKNWKYNKDINGWNCQLIKTGPEDEYLDYEHCFKNIQAKFYGMASTQGQEDISGGKTKTSEGCVKTLPVTYKLHQWIENMSDYLRSAMSYCGIFDIKDFNANNVICNVINQQSFNK